MGHMGIPFPLTLHEWSGTERIMQHGLDCQVLRMHVAFARHFALSAVAMEVISRCRVYSLGDCNSNCSYTSSMYPHIPTVNFQGSVLAVISRYLSSVIRWQKLRRFACSFHESMIRGYKFPSVPVVIAGIFHWLHYMLPGLDLFLRAWERKLGLNVNEFNPTHRGVRIGKSRVSDTGCGCNRKGLSALDYININQGAHWTIYK